MGFTYKRFGCGFLTRRAGGRATLFDALEARVLLDGTADTQPADIDASQPDMQDTTQPATEPTTEATTEPGTEAITEPATEPTTQPTTQTMPTDTQPTTNSENDNTPNDNSNDTSGFGDIGYDNEYDNGLPETIPPPLAPQYVKATTPARYVKPLVVTLTWVNVDASADQIDVQRFDKQDGWVDVDVIPAWEQTYRDTRAAPGTTYLYALYAENDGGGSEAAFSNDVTTAAPPMAPRDLTAQMDAAGRVTLSWFDGANDHDSFIIQRGDTSGRWSNIAIVPARSFGYVDGGAAGQVAAYRIYAVDGGVISESSNVSGAARLPVVLDLYRDVLGRNGDDAGVNFWSWAYATHTMNAAQIAGAFLGSREYHGIVVDELYEQILNRAPDAGGFNGWVNYLDRNTVEAARAQFYGSEEYARLHGSTASGAVSAWYVAILGRAADGAGLAEWTRVLNSGVGRSAVVQTIASSREAEEKVVRGLYQVYLHRGVDPGGLMNWTNVLLRGAAQSVVATGLLGSAEYFTIGTEAVGH